MKIELPLETYSIEAAVIRVNGHKMTLSVFDQLPVVYANDIFDFDEFDYDEEWIWGICPGFWNDDSDGYVHSQEEESDCGLTIGHFVRRFAKAGALGYVRRKEFWLLAIHNNRLVKVMPRVYWIEQRYKRPGERKSRPVFTLISAAESALQQIFIGT